MSALGVIAVMIVGTICALVILTAVLVVLAVKRMPDDEPTWSYGEADQ